MFYCKVCQEKNKWPASLAKSIGNCEVCGTRDLCNDVKSSNLPIMKGNDMEHTGKIEITDTNSHGDYYIGNKDKYIAIVVMDVLSSEDIAKANAEEIVRRWNAFEDGGLVEELRTACSCLLRVIMRDEPKGGSISNEGVELANAALAKS